MMARRQAESAMKVMGRRSTLCVLLASATLFALIFGLCSPAGAFERPLGEIKRVPGVELRRLPDFGNDLGVTGFPGFESSDSQKHCGPASACGRPAGPITSPTGGGTSTPPVPTSRAVWAWAAVVVARLVSPARAAIRAVYSSYASERPEVTRVAGSLSPAPSRRG